MHINSISCGQGGPSLFLIVAAGEGVFPASVVITADTGWENDCLWSTGERTNAATFFNQVTKPLAEEYGMSAYFVRAQDGNGVPLPPLQDTQALGTEDIPLFGSRGGKLKQSCTSKYKIAAIRQQLRRLGATTATTNMGLTVDEVHRMRTNDVKWETKAYPLIDAGIYRATIQEQLDKRKIPYLVTSQCDGCPHKDFPRWQRTSPGTLIELAEFEAKFNGEFFLTGARIPLLQAIDRMSARKSMDMFEPCDDGYCFV